jgi:hypothetical protein
MSGVVQFIISTLKIAIFIAIIGDLTTATHIMMNQAAKAHQHRGISFKKINQMLIGKEK